MSGFFEFAEKHELALFPMLYGSKDPFGIVSSFAHDWSRDPAQWRAWRSERKCNFGIVAGPSRIVIVDIDVAEVGKAVAWGYWVEWCQSRGLRVFEPYCVSARGGWHVAFRLSDGLDVTTLRQVPLIGPIEGVSKKPIIDLRIGNGYTVAPESFYNGIPKGEESGLYRLHSDVAPHACPAELLAACTRAKSGTVAVAANKADPGDTARVLEWMAEHDCFDSYWPWVEAGMILRAEFGDDPGFALWQIINNGTCSAETEAAKWQSFSPNATSDDVKIGTLRRKAKQAGCPHRIGKCAKKMFEGVVQQLAASPPLVPPLPYPAASVTSPDPTPPARLIKSSAEFVADFVAPSYLLDGILQKHFCYALTAATGAGKTAIALRLAAHVALGRKLGDRDVERGRVLYFAAENYVDVQARWIAMAQHCGFDASAIDAFFVSGATKLSEIAERITTEARAIGDLALIVVDTSAATFEGGDENGNVDSLVHAKRMRSLTELQGNPSVLVLCHPVKSATNDNLVPRGGGAFLAEIDGNLCARKGDSSVEVHWAGKFRGMDFAPMAFRLDTVVAQRLKDAKGRSMPTVLAAPIDEVAKQVLVASERSDQDQVLRAIDKAPGESTYKIAERLGWRMGNGKPYAVRVQRAAERMAGDGLLIKHRGNWVLSSRGEKELNKLDRQGGADGRNNAVSMLPLIPARNLQ